MAMASNFMFIICGLFKVLPNCNSFLLIPFTFKTILLHKNKWKKSPYPLGQLLLVFKNLVGEGRAVAEAGAAEAAAQIFLGAETA
jgi:hypothetical protein